MRKEIVIMQKCQTANAYTIMDKFRALFNKTYIGITNDLFPFRKLYDNKYQILIEVQECNYCSLGGVDSEEEGQAIIEDIKSNFGTFYQYELPSLWINAMNYSVASTESLKENYFDLFDCKDETQEKKK